MVEDLGVNLYLKSLEEQFMAIKKEKTKNVEKFIGYCYYESR